MNEDDLENKWLNIAYSEKKNKKVEFERVLAGAKGVGRFSCDRLGEYLDIYTRKKNGKIYHLFVDWKSFEIEDRQDIEIQNINVELEEIPQDQFTTITGFDLFESGTILEISKLRSKWANPEKNTKNEIVGWDVKRIVDLKKSLEKLINPNQDFNKTSFEIFLEAKEFIYEDRSKPEYNKINCEIKNRIFEKLEFTSTCITSFIDKTGEIVTTTITDKGRDIFILQEKNTSFPLLKDVTIVLYFLNRYSKIYFAKETGIRSFEFGSVYLFINGFRIPPYGDFGDDWLGLDSRKGQGYARNLGTREIVGRIEIKDDNNQFKIVSSREGVVKDENINQLTEKEGYFYSTLKRLEKYVVDGLDWDRLSKKGKTSSEEEDQVNGNLKKYINEFEKKVNSKDWKFSPADEVYFENQQVKNKRIISIIDDIIDVPPENIIDLYINEELIIELVNAEKAKAQEEFQKIIKDVPNLTDAQVSSLVSEIEKSKTELETSLAKIAGFKGNKINVGTNVAIDDSEEILSDTNRHISESKDIINELIRQKNEAEQKRQEEVEARKKAEDEKKKLEEELALEKEKNTYLRTSSRSLSEDAKGLVHNIKHTSKQIKSSIDSLYNSIQSGRMKEKDLIAKLLTIKFNADKVLKISSIITRANFKADKNHQTIDLVKYICQYIDIYSDIFDKTKLSFKVVDNDLSYLKLISALDIALIFDDLISNSEKAGADNVLIELAKPDDSLLEITFSDDGEGVDDKFVNNPEAMFELGITTTDGSGIGLHSVRKALSNMQGEIQFLGNGKVLKGASFKISFQK